MKTRILIYLFLFAFSTLQSQNSEIIEDKVYRFKFGIELIECKTNGEPVIDMLSGSPSATTYKSIIAEKGWKFRIDKILENNVVITFINWVGTDPVLAQRNKDFVYDNDKKYFLLTKDKLKRSSEIVSARIEIEFGTVTIPIKIRPGNGENIPLDFYGNFNAGVGLSFRLRNILDIYSGISITSVPVDSETTNGVITSTTNAAALTPTFGVLKEVGKAQFGLFVGFDFLSRNLGKNWTYQGRRWFGIGIGYNIFSVSKGQENVKGQ
ncbi:hypothetical protein [Ichthyenterobacterium magnum]|uniref:Uncharacterized protein n=1 Tax=Ichthyenterobacterium magnum TaxID=1230530 RepID=A0A420DLP6_9FLAO|nr:hypothetical protein [Ichthyenterobacterium magnum]RKE95163.1 hypothetical protein BXY80_1348 [Ichthyenterobacterium magnum]